MEKFQNTYRIPSARLPFWNYGNSAAYFITICTKNREYFFGEMVGDGIAAVVVETPCMASLPPIPSSDDNSETPLTDTPFISDTRCIAYLQTNDNNKQGPFMQLSPLGKIVEQEWIKTTELRPDMNLQLDEFVVMPNHFHAIIIIGENKYNGTDAMNDGIKLTTTDGDVVCRDAMHCVSTCTEYGSDKNSNGIHLFPGNTANKFGPQFKNLGSIIRGFKSAVTTQARKMGNYEFAWQPRFHDHIIRNDASFERIQTYIRNNPLNWKEDKFFGR